MYTLLLSLLPRLFPGIISAVLVVIQEIDRDQWADSHPGEPFPIEHERWTAKDYARRLIQEHLARRRKAKLARIAKVLNKKIP